MVPPEGRARGQIQGPNRVGIATKDRARIFDVEAAVSKTPGPERKLEQRVHEIAVLENRAEWLRPRSRVVLDQKWKKDILLDGDWQQTDAGLEAAGPASLRSIREVADGQVSFEIQFDDGPGIQIDLGKDVSWVLPGSALQPQFRKVVVTFDLAKNGQVATCRYEHFRLETKLKAAMARVPVRISLLGRTKATIRGLEVVECSRPAAK